MSKSIRCVATVVCWSAVFSPVLAQQELPKGFNQYKRVHQDALKKMVAGNTSEVIADLTAVLKQLPADAETHYMLAVAHAKAGDRDAAIESSRRAVAAGLPVSRFFTGTKTGLESIRSAPEMQRLQANSDDLIAHGPMLGCVTGSSVRVWVRTVGARRVSVLASKVDGGPEQQSSSANTSADTDYTAVLELNGLEPNTNYHYGLNVATDDGTAATSRGDFHFKTLADPGSPVQFRLAFGGGAGFVPHHEYMWSTIAREHPDVLLLLGDNVYSDAPKMPEMQHYCYYRRQARPEFRSLVSTTPVYSIWDDHDFGTNDCSGGPAIFDPAWKLPVYRVFRNNWVNPYYGGGESQPGCYYDFYIGDVHFIMLDGRYYRDLNPADGSIPTMLGPAQRRWLLDKIQASDGKLLVLCSPVPWVFKAKGDSKDTWNGFKQERKQVFDFLTAHDAEGVVLMSADRHRSDLWKVERPNDYALYEFNSSRLTNQHVHKEMDEAIFSYNKKQSFGTVDFDTTVEDPTITYRVMSIDGEQIHKYTVRRSELTSE